MPYSPGVQPEGQTVGHEPAGTFLTTGQDFPGKPSSKQERFLLQICPSKSLSPGPPKQRGVLSVQGLFGGPRVRCLPCAFPTGLLSVLELSAQAIIYELATLIYMVSLHLGHL